MRKILFYSLFLWFLTSCGEEETFDPLRQPPYDQITDSIQKQPDNAALYFRRATLLYVNNQPVFAEKDLRKAWELDPQELYAKNLAFYLQQRNVDSSITFVESALEKFPNSIELRLELANAYLQKQDLNAVLAVCDTIINRYPGQLDALQLKAETLLELEKTREAIAVLEQAYEFAPDDPAIMQALAFSYAEIKDPKAIAISDALIAMDPKKKHAGPYFFKGVYYYNKGNFPEAIRFFNMTIQYNFKYMDAYINKGMIYFDQKDYTKALETFNQALNVDPTYADVYYWLGKTKEAMGQKEEAKLNYLKAFGLDKTNTRAKEAADKL